MKHPYFNQYKFKYATWNDSDFIHEMTLMWQSQMEFIKGEHSFLKELLAENTLSLLAENSFEQARHLVVDLNKVFAELTEIQQKIVAHRNNIIVLMDGVDEFQKERAFQDTHLLLELRINSFLEKYQILKDEIFKTMQDVFKKSKNKSLLKP